MRLPETAPSRISVEDSRPYSSEMTYEEALRLWYSRINYEQRTPRPGDLKLDRMRALLDCLGNPHQRLRILHVAGSKGKGSVCAMLEAVLRQAGYRTGLFTSPHLSAVEERIRVAGAPVTRAELSCLVAEVDAAARRVERRQPAGSAAVTFFELATALGFLHFVRRRVEVAVIEVGLGGRFDATNVCLPEVALITSISYDHTQQLGNTLAQIAREKAGIIKPGRPVISGVRAAEARAVIEQVSQQRRAPLWQLDRDFFYRYEPALITEALERPPRVQVTTPQQHWPPLEVGLLGEHQAANAAVVLLAVERLRAAGWHLPLPAVAAGLAQVHWPARLEVLQRRPLLLLDCAHNVASVQALVETLTVSFPQHPPQRRVLVFAASTDKDLAGMLAVLAPHFRHAYLTRFRGSRRAAAPEQLAALLSACAPLPWTICPQADQACRQALAAARLEDLVCITGSVFLAGEVRPWLLAEVASPEARRHTPAGP